MATRLKTLEYWFPPLATLPDNSSTALTQITVYIPESSVSFQSVFAECIVADQFTTATNNTQRSISLTLQGASPSTVSNTNKMTQSGENIIMHFSGDFTSYFTSNWSGSSMTLDGALLVNTSATGSANASVRVVITYQYDDTSSTHIKTVKIPLDAPTTALATTKPGTATDTIPALDTYCPEASKTFRQTTIVVQGNQESAATVDMSISFEVDSNGVYTSSVYEKGLNTSSFYRTNDVVSFDTSSTHNFYIWASATDFDHPQVYLVATYEFDPSSTTTVLNSLQMPMEWGGCFGGPTSSDYQRAERDLWIEEPGTITGQRIALYMFWDELGAMSGLNFRVGTGSFQSYSSVAATVAGSCAAMIRNDSAFTLARGRNTLQADAYNTDTVDLGFNVSSFWLINYTSGKATDGVGAHNHTVSWNLKTTGTTAASNQSITSAVALDIPESTHFKNSVGVNYIYTTNTTGNAAGVHIGTERLVAEGGLIWENTYEAFGGTDPEVGVRQCWASARSVFRRFVDGSVVDADATRLDIETSRRWRVANSAASFDHLDIVMTYHSISFAVTGSVTGSSGGTVNLYLHRHSNREVLMSTTRSGDGSYTFNWFDDTEDVYVSAYEDGTHVGRSDIDVAV